MKNDNGDSPNAAALFEAANKLRGSVESAEYKHLVLGLLFLKYISDSFALRRDELEGELCDPTSDQDQVAEILEDRDEYVAENVFWVAEDARWEKLLAAASQPEVQDQRLHQQIGSSGTRQLPRSSGQRRDLEDLGSLRPPGPWARLREHRQVMDVR